MEVRSFKQMIQAGDVRRADAMKVRLEDIHEEPGFNLRDENAVGLDGKTFDESIDELAEYIAGGGIFPDLEVRPRAAGGVFVVDGHRRRRALLKLDAAGRLPRVPRKDDPSVLEFWVGVKSFEGNDAARTARVLTSAENRGLTPLEVARGYRRLAGFGLTPDEIAGLVRKTRQHVDQMLVLANANTDVQKLVAAGGVSAAVAVKVARQHGENAGQVLQQELDKAKAAGKAKVTDGTIKGKALPVKVLQGLADEVDAFMAELPKETRQSLAELERDTDERGHARGSVYVPSRLLLALMAEHAKVSAARDKQAERQREKAAKAAQQGLV